MLHSRCVLAVCALLAVGCGGSAAKLYPASGTVTFEDKPVEGATVMFIPQQGAPGMGTTDASGKYTVSTRGQPGVPLGTYNVTVSKQSDTSPEAETGGGPSTEVTGDGPSAAQMERFQQEQKDLADRMRNAGKETKPKDLLPGKYAIPMGSPLNATVTTDAAKNVFDFPLTP